MLPARYRALVHEQNARDFLSIRLSAVLSAAYWWAQADPAEIVTLPIALDILRPWRKRNR